SEASRLTRPLDLRGGRAPADVAATVSASGAERGTGIAERAAVRRSVLSSAAARRAAFARAVLTRARAISNTSALSRARWFWAYALPRPPTSSTRTAAWRRYCPRYFLRARRTRSC